MGQSTPSDDKTRAKVNAADESLQLGAPELDPVVGTNEIGNRQAPWEGFSVTIIA